MVGFLLQAAIGNTLSKPIKISHTEWINLSIKILEKHPLSVILVRDKMKKVLGFTNREHTIWNKEESMYETIMYLDFYDEKKRTYFLLKYGEYLTHYDVL